MSTAFRPTYRGGYRGHSDRHYMQMTRPGRQSQQCDPPIYTQMPRPGRHFQQYDPPSRPKQQRDGVSITAISIDLGMMRNEREFLSMKRLENASVLPQDLSTLFLSPKELEIAFVLPQSDASDRFFQCKIPQSQVKALTYWRDSHGQSNLLVQLRLPPILNRKKSDVTTARHASGAWEDRSMWSRQVSTRTFAEKEAAKAADVQNDIDIGRWLAYRFVVATRDDRKVATFCQSLVAHDVVVKEYHIEVVPYASDTTWDWLRPSKSVRSTLEAMHLDAGITHLPFEVAYQLEVCLSHRIVHESNLTPEFVDKIAAMVPPPPNKPASVCRLLVKVAASQRTFDNPMDIFKLPKDSANSQRLPSYCTMIHSATVTPTTIYFHSPLVDTSNRILRKYKYIEDRFLRVRFRDELYRGRLWPEPDSDEVFQRIKHIMLNGIEVGQRKFEFLAFGNSQFREHGAYFFAPTYDLSAEDIRKDMGIFVDIKIVAKYAARLGQSFSTTRTTTNPVQITNIPDVYHNDYCFTDGVGKISLFTAQMIAQDMRLPTSAQHCPSVYQFRLAGCKGILAIDPQVKGSAVHIRPSQTKFPAKHQTLDICRYSRFSASFLNQLIILILSALGVEDVVFLNRMRTMLADIETAMTSETVALKMLQRSVDINQTTVTLASLINDGFMAAKDPFFITCMRLWRCWSVKYLREKAKILVEQGAFLLGCVDERNVLRGHKYLNETRLAAKDLSDLPEIFVQITEYDAKSPGKIIGYKVIQGICIVARNPALHPGDIRVVMACDKPELHHLRDVVVFPQSGDRDLPSMCSGGDLDGDDFLVIWDPDLIPKEWNFPAMDYTAPPPVVSDGPITVEAIINFFVQHMKHDNLGRIATAHRYWADQLEKGVKDDKCLQLAALHSCAVDYAKTGIPAVMTKDLNTTAWPHWAGNRNVPQHKIYHSKKILGQLYDEVQGVPFEPAWDLSFDDRILEACDYKDSLWIAYLNEADRLKSEYDDAIRQVMLLFEIATEFEVWTGFVMQHNQDSSDYSLAEKLGNIVTAIKQKYRGLAYERAGTDEKERDPAKMGPFIAAMYAVTADGACHARAKYSSDEWLDDWPYEISDAKLRGRSAVPFISFPWLFAHELGLLAKGELSPTTYDRDTVPTFNYKVSQNRPVTITSISTNQSSLDKGINDTVVLRPEDAVDLPQLEDLETLELPGEGWSIDTFTSKYQDAIPIEELSSTDEGQVSLPKQSDHVLHELPSSPVGVPPEQNNPRRRIMPGTFVDDESW